MIDCLPLLFLELFSFSFVLGISFSWFGVFVRAGHFYILYSPHYYEEDWQIRDENVYTRGKSDS